MAQKPQNIMMNMQSTHQTKQRSALGVGVTTLVTIMTVLLLVAFAVLSLVSARSNLSLSQMAVDQAQMYYSADSEATMWYAKLDDFTAEMSGDPETFSGQLSMAGFQVATQDGELRVTKEFAISETRTLMVTVQVNDDKTTTIRQWQS